VLLVGSAAPNQARTNDGVTALIIAAGNGSMLIALALLAVRYSSLSSNRPPSNQCRVRPTAGCTVRGFFDRSLQSRMRLVRTPAHLTRYHACGQCDSSRVSTPLTEFDAVNSVQTLKAGAFPNPNPTFHHAFCHFTDGVTHCRPGHSLTTPPHPAAKPHCFEHVRMDATKW
jgi:ankyrin repeat protein